VTTRPVTRARLEALADEIVDRYSYAMDRQDLRLTQGQCDILRELLWELIARVAPPDLLTAENWKTHNAHDELIARVATQHTHDLKGWPFHSHGHLANCTNAEDLTPALDTAGRFCCCGGKP